MSIIAVVNELVPPQARSATELLPNEYESAVWPEENWVWDSGLGAHRAPNADEQYQQQRASLEQQIAAQVSDTTVATALEDPGVERDIVRQQAAATDKLDELEKTADVDLATFDPTLEVAAPQDDVGYARLTVSIVHIEPWVGAPDNNVGYVAELQIEKDYASDGADARLSITEAPTGPRGPLPFTVDPDDPLRWSLNVEDGFAWSDPEAGPVKAVLRWGSGSVLVGREATVSGLYDRDPQNVRYGLPGGAGTGNR